MSFFAFNSSLTCKWKAALWAGKMAKLPKKKITKNAVAENVTCTHRKNVKASSLTINVDCFGDKLFSPRAEDKQKKSKTCLYVCLTIWSHFLFAEGENKKSDKLQARDAFLSRLITNNKSSSIWQKLAECSLKFSIDFLSIFPSLPKLCSTISVLFLSPFSESRYLSTLSQFSHRF